MLISYNWLKNYIPDFEIQSPDSLKYKLDTRLSEVEHITVAGEGLSRLVVGQILEAIPHPTNPHLQVCTVDAGEGSTRTIVCGAPNARAGLKTVVCLPGGKVFNSKDHSLMDIGERQMGSVLSAGMMCSPAEIGMGSEHNGIIELPESAGIGTPVAPLLRDTVIEIENKALAHRPDCFSHLGVARELSAIYKTKFEEREHLIPSAHTDDKLEVKVQNQAPEQCLRYSGIVISGVKVGPSPLWLQIAVSYAGLRPINNIVDATNYVMLDVGQPLHAFDISKLNTPEIIVRKAKPRETITTLDGNKRQLPNNSLVIADKDSALAVAGIMGGEHSGINSDTTNIFLESANFEMYGIRRTSRELGLRTDASTRYEKGIDPSMTVGALARVTKLILDIAGGEVSSDLVDIYPTPEQPRLVSIDLNSVKRSLGIELDKSRLVDLLEALHLFIEDVEKISADALMRPDLSLRVNIKVPSYRRDIKAQEDVLEEIARLFGYENVPRTLPKRDLQSAPVSLLRSRILDTKKQMAQSGMFEVYTYTMVGEQLYAQVLLPSTQLLKIANPLSPELALVRDSIVPSLASKLKQNLARIPQFGIFELSKVAYKTKTDNGLPAQPYKLAAAYVHRDTSVAYRYLKQALTNLGGLKVGDVTIVSSDKNQTYPEYLHPGKAAVIMFQGSRIGYIGMLHPLAITNLDLDGNSVAVMEIEMDKVFQANVETYKFIPLTNLQPVNRDLSFWQAEGSSVGDVVIKITEAQIPYLGQVRISDLFSRDGRTSFTLSITIQPTERTLTQAEITEVTDKVTAILSKLKHEVR